METVQVCPFCKLGSVRFTSQSVACVPWRLQGSASSAPLLSLTHVYLFLAMGNTHTHNYTCNGLGWMGMGIEGGDGGYSRP